MLETSTANMSTGATTKHLLTVRAWTPAQHPTTLDCCMTQRKQPVSLLIDGTSAPTWMNLTFANFGQDSRQPDRRVLGKFPRSQHRPSLITPPRLKVPAHSDPVGPSQRWLEALLLSHKWIRWEIATSGHNKYWEGIPGFLREPTICGQTMHPTFCCKELCAMLGQTVRDPLSLLHPSLSGVWLWQSRFVPTISARSEAAGATGGSC